MPTPDRPQDEQRLREVVAAVAPGTAMREGLERILRGRTGALIVMGDDRTVDRLCTGGFELDVPFSATGLRELSKMDGAIVLSRDLGRIVRAAVHLMPDPSIETTETGTRHRTADRVARQTGLPVVSVSASMHIIAVYSGDQRYVLEDPTSILSRANQALATLERYKLRLDEVSGALSALEIEDLVTVRDVAAVAQRLEMVRRIADEIDGYAVELGTDGRLLNLQLDELFAGVDDDRALVARDYTPLPRGRAGRGDGADIGEIADAALAQLEGLDANELLDVAAVARALGLGGAEHLDSATSPRGFRLLARIPRLPGLVIDRLIGDFGSLQQLLAASIDDLQRVDGVGDQRARMVREGLSRLAESSILERYV